MPNSITLAFVTHNPDLRRNRKIRNSLLKKYKIRLVEPPFKSDKRLLGINFSSAMKLFMLGLKSVSVRDPILLDGRAALFFPQKIARYLLDCCGPLSKEIEWWGNRIVSKVMAIQENLLCQNAEAVLVPNEPMERWCRERGANKTFIIPNYPPSGFKPTVPPNIFKVRQKIPIHSKIAIFTTANRLREIYGLDLLLESWKIVEKNLGNALLCIIGPRPDAEMTAKQLKEYIIHRFSLRKIKVVGWVDYKNLPNWINIADVCLAPRTPGFPSQWYNDKDSTKISEYAALRKPIVAAGYSPSNQYLLVDRTPEAFAEGILKAFDGGVKPAEPHFWEENEEKLFNAIERLYPQ